MAHAEDAAALAAISFETARNRRRAPSQAFEERGALRSVELHGDAGDHLFRLGTAAGVVDDHAVSGSARIPGHGA